MGNPICPKCGRIMQTKQQTSYSRKDQLGRPIWGLSRYWVCSNKSLLHGRMRFKVGAQVIPKEAVKP